MGNKEFNTDGFSDSHVCSPVSCGHRANSEADFTSLVLSKMLPLKHAPPWHLACSLCTYTYNICLTYKVQTSNIMYWSGRITQHSND